MGEFKETVFRRKSENVRNGRKSKGRSVGAAVEEVFARLDGSATCTTNRFINVEAVIVMSKVAVASDHLHNV